MRRPPLGQTNIREDRPARDYREPRGRWIRDVPEFVPRG